MSIISRTLVCVFAGALIAGCGSAPYRSGKGNDHLIIYRPANVEETERTKVVETRDVIPAQRVVPERQVIYVQQLQVIYQPAPTYRVMTSGPDYLRGNVAGLPLRVGDALRL
jgi:hypothetical protein